MLQPKKIPTPNEILGSKKSIPSPSDILGVQEKKKDDSTVIDTNSDSETNIGSSVGKNIDKNPNAKMKQFTGFSNSETETLQGKNPTPKINQNISKQLNPKGFEINKLRKKLSDTKVTSENMLDVDKDTNKLIQLEKEQKLAYNKKMEAIGGSLFDKVYTHDKELSLQNLENEKNDNQFIDYAREIGKGAINVASDVLNETLVTPLNAVISGGDKEEFEKKPFFQPFDKFDKFKPLEKAKVQALKENPNLSNDANALKKEAEKIYLQEDAKRQYKKNANDLLQNTDPDIQEAVKSYQIKKLNLKNYDLEANLVRVQLVDKKFENLKKQFAQSPTKENEDLLNTAKAEYLSILKEQDVLSKDINDVKQNIDLFKLNYNPYEKFLNGIASASTKMVGGAMALSAELSPVQGLFPNATKAYAEAGRYLVDIANQNDTEYRRISLDDVETTGEYGRYIAQLFSEQVPNLLVASTGYGGLAMLGAGSGGQKTIEMRKEMELNPKKYSEAQVKVAGVAFALSEAIPEVNTMNMIKGATNTLRSISMDVAERTLFQKGVKDFALNFTKNVVVKPIPQGTKEGLSEDFTGIMQDYVDEKILGNKIKDKKEKRKEEFVSGFIMGDGMTVFAEIPSFIGYVSSQVSTESEMLDIKNRVAKINQLEKELQKEGLFESDLKILKEDLDIAYKGLKQKSIENTKNIESLSKLQIEELVKSNVRQTEIRQEVEVLRNGNLSKEIKQAKAEELKQEFIANEEKRNGIKNGKLTTVDLLPLKEQDQIKRQALEDLVLELNPDGAKNITISNEQIVKRANEIYNESIKNEEKLNQEVKDAETESTVTNEAKPKAEVQEPTNAEQEEVKDAETESTVTNEAKPKAEVQEPTNAEQEEVKDAETESTVTNEAKPKAEVQEPTNAEQEEVKDAETESTVTNEAKPKAEVQEPTNAEQEEVKDAETESTVTNEAKPKAEVQEPTNAEQEEVKDAETQTTTSETQQTPQPQAEEQEKVDEVETLQVGSVGVGGDVEIKNEGKAKAPTKESVTERLNINNPFYRKVEDALVKLGLIEKYNPETGTGDVVGGYAQQTSDGGFSVGKMLFSQDGSISYFDGDVKVSFDKNGNVISENTKEAKQKAVSLEIESKKESIANLEKTRDSEAFKYKEVTETDVLGNKKKVKRLKTPQELKESTDKINAAIDKAKSALSELEQSLKETPQAETNEATPSNTTPTNAGVQPRIGKVGEMGVEQKPTTKVVAEESVQSANDVKPIEAVAHFKKTIDFEIDIDELKKRVQDAEKTTDKKDNKKEQRLAEKIKNYPRQGEFKSYLSQETMEEAHGSVQKDEGYDAVVLVQVGNYGQELIQDAKELYGENYVQELIKLIDSENFRLDEQSLILISLENHIADKLKIDTNNGQLNKLQSFVQGKSKVISNIGSKVVNFGRIRNIMNIGFDVEGQQEKALSDKKKQAKKSIKKVIAKVNSQNVNKQDELEQIDVEEDDFVIEVPKNKRDKKIVQKELADVWAKMKSDIKNKNTDISMAVIPFQNQIIIATPHIIKASKLLAEIGLYNTKEIIEEIYNNIKNEFPDIKTEDIKAILQQKAREGKKLTPEEIEAKKLANRIKNTEQKITDLENNVQKDNTGKSSEWSKELSEAKSKLAILQQKAREGKISNVVKQALIEAGFGRTVNVKTKNGIEARELLDWTLLAGEESSVDSIEKNVLSVLKDKYMPKQLTDINSQLKEEYNRLSAKIIEKGFNDLEKLNQITPSSKRKTESKRLAELYNKGLFESNEYNTLLNKVLGLSPYEIEIQDKIKSQAQALADLYATKLPNGKRLSEIAISNIASDITHNINQLLSTLSRERGGKLFNTVQLYGDVAVMSQKAMLGGIPNLIENFTSAKYQGLLSQKFLMNGNLTPELKEQIKKDKNVIYNDIVKNAGLFYGDTNSSLFSQSRFEDWINGKIDNKLGHVVFSVISLRMFLEAQDSQIKVQLTSNYFIKNLLDTLTSKSNPNGAMTKDDALAYINKELTGDSFEKALVSAKNIIDDINSKQKDGNVLKDDKDAIYRFAMGIVKQNLASDRVLSMDEIEGSFKAGYKSAGRDIGHEANNIVTLGVNYINRMLNKELQDSIRNEHYGVATLVSALSSIYRFTVSPFVGGGTNWIVLQAQKGGLSPMGILGVAQTIADYTRKQPYELDLNTELGRKNYVNSLYRKTNYQASMARQLVGTITGLAMMTAMSVDLGDDEDATDRVISWLSENEWARKYFDKISPSTIVWLTYLREDDLTKFFTRQLNIKTDYYDRNYQVIKSLGNDQDTGAKVAEATTANLIAPFAWKTTADLYDITNGLLGNSPINKEDSSEDFIDALFKNGAVSRFTRIIDNFRENYNEYYENEDLE